MLTRTIFNNSIKLSYLFIRTCTSKRVFSEPEDFETVFKLPSIKYISIIQRLKVYHLIGSSIVIPSCGLLEIINAVPGNTCLVSSYIGVTGLAVLSLISIPFKDIIGFVYINKDNSKIKISSVDFWGKRQDRVIAVEDWIPLMDMKPKTMDAIYLTPTLNDGTKFKLFVKFGQILNSQKFGYILD